MDAKTESIAETQMSSACDINPQMLLDMFIQYEQCKAALYAQLAQTAPTPCLKHTIAQMAMEDPCHATGLVALANAYGLGMVPGGAPIMPPQLFDVEEKKD